MSPSNGIEMLGVRKAATLQEKSKLKHPHKKLGQYIQALSACPLKAQEVWISYKTILNSSIMYPFATTSLSEKETNAMHKRLLPVLLPWLGSQQNFPCDIAFGSKYSGRIRCAHYSAWQLSWKVVGVLKHVCANTKT
eukprot:9534573-Ditylum_brightwellii.AAC.1